MSDPIPTSIRHQEGDRRPVEIVELEGELWVQAYNQGGHDCTAVNLRDVIAWVCEHRPEILEQKQ